MDSNNQNSHALWLTLVARPSAILQKETKEDSVRRQPDDDLATTHRGCETVQDASTQPRGDDLVWSDSPRHDRDSSNNNEQETAVHGCLTTIQPAACKKFRTHARRGTTQEGRTHLPRTGPTNHVSRLCETAENTWRCCAKGGGELTTVRG